MSGWLPLSSYHFTSPYSQQCTSKGGGKHEQPPVFGKGKGKDGGGKGFGKGFGHQGGGKAKGGWGKGKGKVYGVDEQYYQPEWDSGPDWSLAQSGAAAQQQQQQQPQFPWMTAAAAGS